MFQTKGEKGKKLISNAISSFDNITIDLQEGIEHCKSEVSRHENIILDSKEEIDNLNVTMDKANRVHLNIKKLLE